MPLSIMMKISGNVPIPLLIGLSLNPSEINATSSSKQQSVLSFCLSFCLFCTSCTSDIINKLINLTSSSQLLITSEFIPGLPFLRCLGFLDFFIPEFLGMKTCDSWTMSYGPVFQKIRCWKSANA